MRVAAIVFGVFAGLIASLILALGGLDVPPELAAPDSRQEQAIRFALFVIADLGLFGAALALAAPLASGILLVLAAIAWIAAALLLHHSTDLVLVTPPALLLLAAIPAFIAHFRRREAFEDETDDLEIIPPRRAARRAPLVADPDDEPAEAEMPLRVVEPEPEIRPTARFAPPPAQEEWNPRRRRPPPPSARTTFRPVEIEDDDEDEDEPSAFSRLALGVSSVLSFGLYAALAVAALLAVWTLRDTGRDAPAVAVADSAPAPPSAPALTASVEPPPPAASSEPPVLAPILTPQAPLLAAAPPAAEPEEDFEVVVPSDPLAAPRLVPLQAASLPLPESEPEPKPLAEEPPAEPVVEDLPVEPSIAAPGRPVPYQMPPGMAALRNGPATAPRAVAMPAPVDLAGP